MSKDRTERRGYRKSPGRQYGFDYDPLRGGEGQRGQGDRPTRGGYTRGTASQSGSLLTQRPDPRRTRQLLRQNILANKTRPGDTQDEASEEFFEPEEELYDEPPTYTAQRQLSRSGQVASSRISPTRRQEVVEDESWLEDYPDVDPDLGYEEEEDFDPLAARVGYSTRRLARTVDSPDALKIQPRPTRRLQPDEYEEEYEDEYEDDAYEEELYPEEQPRPRRRKKKGLTRRKLLFGLGAAAVAGGGIAAYELGPKIPQALGDAGANIEHQLQDAFNKGLAKGADDVRKEFITTLENLEGVTLEGAVSAAKLTRVAYDVFVSPVVKFSSQIAGDLLKSLLDAFKVGRNWLNRIGQDNATLAAIQTVLESWVGQVKKMPKQIDTITQADLEGAQAYLRALQRKIDEEKAKLNAPQGTPQPAPKATPKPQQKTN